MINKGRISSKGALETEVENWEAKIARLENRYNQPNFLSEEVKMAIFLVMLPYEYQEKILDRMATKAIDDQMDLQKEKEYIFNYNRERGATYKSNQYLNDLGYGGWEESGGWQGYEGASEWDLGA